VQRRYSGLGVGLLALLLVACAASSPSSAPPTAPPASAEEEPASSSAASAFVAATSSGEVNAIYSDSPEELAALSQLVVSGRVVSVGPGPSYSPRSLPQDVFSSVYLEVTPDAVVRGEYPPSENVWILINYVGPEEHVAYSQFLHQGTPLVAYLNEVDLSDGLDGGRDSSWVLSPDSDPVAPGNGRLWIASLQGLVIDLGGRASNLAWPLLGTVGTGELSDTLPPGTLIGRPRE
jgi:hypothetical protein